MTISPVFARGRLGGLDAAASRRYRIAQEQPTDAARRAPAAVVYIDFPVLERRFRLKTADNGRDMPISALETRVPGVGPLTAARD